MEFKRATLEEGLGLEKIKFDDSSVDTSNNIIKEILKSRDQAGQISEKVVSEKMQALFALHPDQSLDKVIFVYHTMDLRRTEFNPQGLVSFMKTNFLSIKNVQDIVYGTIVVKLLSLNILKVTSSRPYTQVTATDIPDHMSWIMDIYVSQARTMMVLALHAYNLGNDFDKIPWYKWYELYTKVRGSYLNQKLFELIVQLIASSQLFSKVPKLLPLDEIVSENNVLKWYQAYKAMANISASDIIFKAKVEAVMSKGKEKTPSES